MSLFPCGVCAEGSDDYVSIGLGVYDSFRALDIYDHQNFATTDFRLEYRADSADLFWGIAPHVSLEYTGEDSFWGGAGLYRDFYVTDQFIITPNVAVGAYNQGSSDLDLGGTLEFRNQIEFTYEMENDWRLGASIGHISNAGTGDDNPGTEIINIYYHIPVGRVF